MVSFISVVSQTEKAMSAFSFINAKIAQFGGRRNRGELWFLLSKYTLRNKQSVGSNLNGFLHTNYINYILIVNILFTIQTLVNKMFKTCFITLPYQTFKIFIF